MWVQHTPTPPLSTHQEEAKATSPVKLAHLNETADGTSNSVVRGTGYPCTWGNNNNKQHLMKTAFQRPCQELRSVILLDPLNYCEGCALIIPFLAGGNEAGTRSLNELFKDTERSMGELRQEPRKSPSKPS